MTDAALILGVLLAGGWDLARRKIPNWLTFGLMGLGLVMGFIAGGLEGLADSLQGLLLGGALLFIPFLLGGMGAGDVKLLAAIGALKGSSFVLRAFLYGALAGGALALGALLVGRYFFYRPRTIPYGVALMVGAFAALYGGGI